MRVKYDVPGTERKNLAREIAKWLCIDVKYLGAPSFAYEIGACRLDPDGSLTINTNPNNMFIEPLLEHIENEGYKHIDEGPQDAESSDLKTAPLNDYGGLDLSSTTDITAFVLVFPSEDENDKYYILPYFWIPEDNLDLRVRRDHVPYDIWRQEGRLQTTEGKVVHYGFIENFIEELGTKYNIREIAFDRWGAVQMVQNLEGMGFTVVPFGQGFKDMSPPSKELMKLTLEGKLAHSGHPVLCWMIDNIFIRTDPAGNINS